MMSMWGCVNKHDDAKKVSEQEQEHRLTLTLNHELPTFLILITAINEAKEKTISKFMTDADSLCKQQNTSIRFVIATNLKLGNKIVRPYEKIKVEYDAVDAKPFMKCTTCAMGMAYFDKKQNKIGTIYSGLINLYTLLEMVKS